MQKFSTIYLLLIVLSEANGDIDLIKTLQDGMILKISHQEVEKLNIQILDSSGTQGGEPLILVQGLRPKVALIPNVGFALGWIGTQIEQPFLFLQIFSLELNTIVEQQKIVAVHQDVIWDLVSEYHYIEFIVGTKLQVFYKSPMGYQQWWGFVFDIINPQKVYYEIMQIPYSQLLDIIVNDSKLKIDIFQKIDETYQRQITLAPQDQNQGWNTRAIITFCQISSNKNSYRYNCKRDCQDGCQTCLTLSHCLICEEGFTLNEQNCEKNQCKSGCHKCNIQQECIKCALGYSFSEDTIDCLKCPENCLACTVPSICDECEDNFEWDEYFMECFDYVSCPLGNKSNYPYNSFVPYFGLLLLLQF